MKAVVYKEPFRVAVEKVPDPKIQLPSMRAKDRCGSLLENFLKKGSVSAQDSATLKCITANSGI
jgi:hypothetical protein